MIGAIDLIALFSNGKFSIENYVFYRILRPASVCELLHTVKQTQFGDLPGAPARGLPQILHVP